jgi:squalene-associated FAD-dependent desaturase
MDEVLIIGGGFAGLTAGVALAEAGRQVRLLEQKPHLGGRARSFTDPTTGSIVDNGQHILMGCYHATQRFLAALGTLDRIDFQPRLRLQFLEAPGQLTSLDCPNLPAPWHLLAGVLRSGSFTWREKLQILRLGRRFAFSPSASPSNGFDRLTVEEWLAHLGQSEKLRRKFWDLISIAALNEDPRIASAPLFERVLRLALFTSAADSRLGLGRVGLSECYTEAAKNYIEARGGKVELSRSVAGVLINDGACEGVQQANGDTLAGRTVLSAVPWFQLPPLLPGGLLREEPFFGGILSLRPAPIISLYLWFDRPITDLDFAGLRGTAFQWLFNKGSVHGSNDHCVSLVLSGAHAHIDRGKEELIALARRELGELLPPARSAQVIHALLIKERFATFSPTWEAEQVRPSATTPVRGLYLAGDWIATGLPATIEGAVQSGYSAAEAILQAG